MNILNQNRHIKITIFQSRVINLFLLAVFFLTLQCATTTPRKDFPKNNFNTNLAIKEFSPAKVKWRAPILMFDPILLKESALFRIENNTEKGLISYLNEAGYTVYLVSAKTANHDLKQEAQEIDSIINQIGEKHKNQEIILAGVSLGGQTILEYMTIASNLNSYAKIKKIFFIGTGIDYNYTNSFAEKSESLGYENQTIKNLCKEKKGDNFCNRYIRSNNALQKVDNTQKEKFFNKIPKLEKDFLSRFHKTKMQLPYFFLYGKLDSISSEESIYPFFHKIRPSTSLGDSKNTLFEAGEANGHTIDYDHADLFLFEKADKEIYPSLLKWLEE